MKLPFLILILILILISGCVVARPHLRETTSTWTNGLIVVQREMWVPTYAAWPASQTIDRQHASMGKTFSVNTAGMNEQTGGTNVVEALKAIDSIISHLPK